jgi:hypothetical protein
MATIEATMTTSGILSKKYRADPMSPMIEGM